MNTTIRDETVMQRTGKNWQQWFSLLDQHGAAQLAHKAIAQYLQTDHYISPWWSQMITVQYELDRGLRKKHQKANGYAASVSKTFAVPVAQLFNAWVDETLRAQWLNHPLTIHKATPNKALRITWQDGTKSVSVNFYPKGPKTQLTIDHEQLADAKQVDTTKAFWQAALLKLQLLA